MPDSLLRHFHFRPHPKLRAPRTFAERRDTNPTGVLFSPVDELTLNLPAGLPLTCVSCCEPATKSRIVRAVHGFNAFVVRYQRWMRVGVPLCQRCARRRSSGSFLIAPAAIILGLGVPIAATAAAVSGRIPSSVQIPLILIGLAWLMVFANFGEQWLDYRLIGVKGVRFSEKPPTITLRFRDVARASHISAALNARPTAPSPATRD